MKKDRREFIRKTGAMAALSIAGINPVASEMMNFVERKEIQSNRSSRLKKPDYIQDAGIKMCFAYFSGIEAEKRKVEFGKQLNVLGACNKLGTYNKRQTRPWWSPGNSNERPGYSALGSLYAAGYIRGLIEAIAKNG